MSTKTENKNRTWALLFALSFHILLFLAFLLWKIITPIPPFEIVEVPEIEIGLGMEGFGQNASGSGQNEPDLNATPDAVVNNNVIADNAPNIITDEKETETVVIKTNPNNTKPTNSETVTPEVQKPTTELQKALEALKSKKNHKGKGEGNGNTGGSGNGTSTGVGNGNEPEEGNDPNGHGPGGSGGPDLKGRQLVKKPASMTDTEEEGVVVVAIVVDETGKVIKATPGARGSTTTSATLYAKARLAALQAKFNANPNGAKEQQGTYTFVFTLE